MTINIPKKKQDAKFNNRVRDHIIKIKQTPSPKTLTRTLAILTLRIVNLKTHRRSWVVQKILMKTTRSKSQMRNQQNQVLKTLNKSQSTTKVWTFSIALQTQLLNRYPSAEVIVAEEKEAGEATTKEAGQATEVEEGEATIMAVIEEAVTITGQGKVEERLGARTNRTEIQAIIEEVAMKVKNTVINCKTPTIQTITEKVMTEIKRKMTVSLIDRKCEEGTNTEEEGVAATVVAMAGRTPIEVVEEEVAAVIAPIPAVEEVVQCAKPAKTSVMKKRLVRYHLRTSNSTTNSLKRVLENQTSHIGSKIETATASLARESVVKRSIVTTAMARTTDSTTRRSATSSSPRNRTTGSLVLAKRRRIKLKMTAPAKILKKIKIEWLFLYRYHYWH